MLDTLLCRFCCRLLLFATLKTAAGTFCWWSPSSNYCNCNKHHQGGGGGAGGGAIVVVAESGAAMLNSFPWRILSLNGQLGFFLFIRSRTHKKTHSLKRAVSFRSTRPRGIVSIWFC
ncbi:hypothetical protein SUGI_0614980 [Cryptomeria japonica]|nr:hypothetical protein SUGI_0614980 [Cryptomeria japonica]